jgi:hypothetical protein
MPEMLEQQLAALLRLFRPPPAAWVAAASEIPRLERDVEDPPDFARPVGGPAHETDAAHETNAAPEPERSPERG